MTDETRLVGVFVLASLASSSSDESSSRLLFPAVDSSIAVLAPKRLLETLSLPLGKSISSSSLEELAAFVAADSNHQRGEIVLLVAPAPPREQALEPQVAALLERLAQELPGKRAAAVVADIYGLRKKMLYDYLLQNK